MPAVLTGGCQCGAVRYRLTTMPEEASICHCRMCQKASGQPFMALTRVRQDGLQWTRGAPAIFRSSSIGQRGFCKACGTPLTYKVEGETISVSIGTLDDPASAPPMVQYGVENELAWCATLATLPRVRTEEDMRPELAARFVNHQHPDRDV